jgi:hypothetical protein
MSAGTDNYVQENELLKLQSMFDAGGPEAATALLKKSPSFYHRSVNSNALKSFSMPTNVIPMTTGGRRHWQRFV